METDDEHDEVFHSLFLDRRKNLSIKHPIVETSAERENTAKQVTWGETSETLRRREANIKI
jgi:hypothetical protein